MYNELHNSIKKYLNRINSDHDLGSSEICFYPVAPEDGRFLPEISDGDGSCYYPDELTALKSAQKASFVEPGPDANTSIWTALSSDEIQRPESVSRELRRTYLRILLLDELEDLSNKIPEEFWDYTQQFGTSEHPVCVESHFDVDDAIENYPELEEEILSYRSKCMEAGTLIIKNSSEALAKLNRESFVSFHQARSLINEAFRYEMDFGDAPCRGLLQEATRNAGSWTRTAHELISKICED